MPGLVQRTSFATLTIVALFLTCAAVAAGQPTDRAVSGAVSGAVIDASGGVLPGVTVTATSADGRLLATLVTNHAGEFAFAALPAAPTTFAFELGGFASADVTLTVQAGRESQVVERLDLAALTETVEVRGLVPDTPPARTGAPRRAPPILIPVPAHDRDAICGPAKPEGEPDWLGTIARGGDLPEDRLHTAGSELIVHGGTDHGLNVGRNLVVRRRYSVEGGAPGDAVREHSAGLVQIVEASDHESRAVVVYACDEVRTGDFLASFDPESAREQDPGGRVDYSEARRILFADEGQMLGSPRRLMVIERGKEQGAFVGERVVLFRQRGRATSTAQRVIVGSAVIVAVRAGSATIRIERVTDAISAGDWAAPIVDPSRTMSRR